MPALRVIRTGVQRFRPYAGRMIHNIKTKPSWGLGAGAVGGLGAGYLAGKLSQPSYEEYEEKKKDGTYIKKIFKKDDGSVNILGVLLLIGIIAGIYWYMSKNKNSE